MLTQRLLLPFAFAALAAPLALARSAPPQGQESEQAPLYDETADAHADVAAALARAGRKNKRVLLQWGANWCGWCTKLHGLFTENAGVRKELLYEYEVVHVDLGRFDRNLALAQAYGATPKEHGVPFLTVLAADGSVLANQETGALEEGDHHDPVKVLEFLRAHEAAPLDAGRLLDEARARAAASKKPLLVEFDAPWCGWCRRFEAWLDEPEVRRLFGARIERVEIDTDRTTGGAELFDSLRGERQGGLPWFRFEGAGGEEIAACVGPEGNVGCPSTDPEIAWFLGMLDAALPGLPVEDRLVLESSLVRRRQGGKLQEAIPFDALGVTVTLGDARLFWRDDGLVDDLDEHQAAVVAEFGLDAAELEYTNAAFNGRTLTWTNDEGRWAVSFARTAPDERVARARLVHERVHALSHLAPERLDEVYAAAGERGWLVDWDAHDEEMRATLVEILSIVAGGVPLEALSGSELLVEGVGILTEARGLGR